MRLLDRSRQHGYLAPGMGCQRIASSGGDDAGQFAEDGTQPADFHTQAHAVRFIGGLDPENLLDQRFSLHVARSGFGQ